MPDFQSQKAVVRAYYDAMDAAAADETTQVLAQYHDPDLKWHGFHPFNDLVGPEAVAKTFWRPLKTSLTSMQRRLDLFMAGANDIDGGASIWVGSMGHLMGLFDKPWLGIRPTGKIAMLRYAAFHRVKGDKIHDGNVLRHSTPHGASWSKPVSTADGRRIGATRPDDP